MAHHPLLAAACTGDVELVQQLLTLGAPVDERTSPEGNTALHLAAAGGHVLVVRELLRAGADACSLNEADETPRDVAGTAAGCLPAAKQEVEELLHMGLVLQELAKDPFDPQAFTQMVNLCDLAYRSEGDIKPAPLQHLLALGIIPALQVQLLLLDMYRISLTDDSPEAASAGGLHCRQEAPDAPPLTAPSSSQHARGGILGVTRFCGTLALLVRRLQTYVMLERVAQDAACEPGCSELMALQQLLSSTASLKVTVRRGLSAEVQEAARGGNAAARGCLWQVGCLLCHAAYVLFRKLHDHPGSSQLEGVRQQLVDFLGLEENLPYLELLCLPLEREPEDRIIVANGSWILASYACAPEHAVGARALLFGSSKLKERLWGALEKLERDAGALHRGSLAAARAGAEALATEVAVLLPLLKCLHSSKKSVLRELLCNKTALLLVRVLRALIPPHQGDSSGPSTSSAVSSSSKKSAKKAAKSAKTQQPKVPGMLRAVSLHHKAQQWAVLVLQLACRHTELRALVLAQQLLLDWLEVMPAALGPGCGDALSLGLQVLATAVTDMQAEALRSGDGIGGHRIPLVAQVVQRLKSAHWQTLLALPASRLHDTPLQVAAMDLYAMLSAVHPKAVPVSTLVAMLLHAVDQQPTATAADGAVDEDDPSMHAVFDGMDILYQHSAVLQQDVQSAIELAIRVLQYNEALERRLIEPPEATTGIALELICSAFLNNPSQGPRCFLESAAAVPLVTRRIAGPIVPRITPHAMQLVTMMYAYAG